MASRLITRQQRLKRFESKNLPSEINDSKVNSNQTSGQSKTRYHFIPPQIGTGWEYVGVLFISAFCCIAAVYWSASQLFSDGDVPLIVASMGASAVIMFSSPASPMASSWAFVVGNSLSALVGMTIFLVFGNTALSAGLAVATAIMIMHISHSMHPPGGATALFAVVGGPLVENLGYWYVLAPVVFNVSVFFVFVRLNRKFLIHRQQQLHYTSKLHDAVLNHLTEHSQSKDSGIDTADIEQALTLVGGNPDVSPEYLKQIFDNTLASAQLREMRNNGYHELQISPPTMKFGDDLLQAWQLLRRDHHNVIVVLYPNQHIVGVLTFADFFGLEGIEHSEKLFSVKDSAALYKRIEQALQPSGLLETTRPEVCGQLAHSIPQIDDLELIDSVLTKDSPEFVALVNIDGRYQYLLTKQ